MKKAKAKSKAAQKSSRKILAVADESVELSAVRKEIAKIVREGAAKMAQAVVDEAMKGEVAPMKYLFEMTGLHPGAGENEVAAPTDVLARVLLKRLGLPEDPVFVPESDAPIRLSSDEASSQPTAGALAIAQAAGDGDEVVA